MNSLQRVLQAHFGAQLQPINQIPDCTCVNSTYSVIDFDAVKRQYCIRFNLPNQLKSADCLHIDLAKRIICFMEVKDASAHITRNWPNPLPTDQQACIDAFDMWLIKLRSDLRAKFADSVYMITSALAQYNTDTADIRAIIDRNDVKIKYFAIFCLNNRDSLTYSLASLQTINRNSICHGVIAGNQSKAYVFISDELELYIANFL